MNETQQHIRAILNSADSSLRRFIADLDRIVSTPTRDWEFETRRGAMRALEKSACHNAEQFGVWIDNNVWMKGIMEMHGTFLAIADTAKGAAFEGSNTRIWGRGPLRKYLETLVRLFGNGCECEPEIGGEETVQPVPETRNAKRDEYLTVAEVASLLRISRQTVIRHFESCSGVLYLGGLDAPRKNGRRYRTLRIPRRVLNRFIQERQFRSR